MNNDAHRAIAVPMERLGAVLDQWSDATIAVSGGVDSMTLASFAHRRLGRDRVRMVHAVSPAVPQAASARVRAQAGAEGWRLDVADAGEFNDDRYRANPVNRCYYCKSNLYGVLASIPGTVVLSGANRDDLGDYRPGLRAAAEHGVCHPYIEAGFDKAQVRALARVLGLPELAELPASPCLASRVETGIPIDPLALEMIDQVEEWLKSTIAPETVRCRLRRDDLVIELDPRTLAGLSAERKAGLLNELRGQLPAEWRGGEIRILSYRRGSAFIGPKEQTDP